MKKVILSIILIASVAIFANTAVAQYAIPSFNVPVIADPTTFEEVTSASPSTNPELTKTLQSNPFSQKPSASDGERDLYIKVKDRDIATTASAIVEIYSLCGSITYGPYTVTEGNTLIKTLSTNYQWGVSTLSSTEGCEMDVWFE